MENCAFDSGQTSADRRCRALGHVYAKQTYQPGAPPPNSFVLENSDTCFRCSEPYNSDDLFKYEDK